MTTPPITIKLDDIVQMRKPHPCGSRQWKITRVGVDVGLECLGCGRRVQLPRGKFNKQVKKKIASPPSSN